MPARQGCPLEEIAILCRTNARLADFEEALHEAGIPFQGVVAARPRGGAAAAARCSTRDGPADEAARGCALAEPAGSRRRPTSSASASRHARPIWRASSGSPRSSTTATGAGFVAELRAALRRRAATAPAACICSPTTARRASSSTPSSCRGSRRGSCRPSWPARTSEIAEERRLLYVGITAREARARVTGRASRARSSPSSASAPPRRAPGAAAEPRAARRSSALRGAGGSSARGGGGARLRRLPQRDARGDRRAAAGDARRAGRRSRASGPAKLERYGEEVLAGAGRS